MYDEIVINIDLTSDEMDLVKELLFYRLDKCVSISEENIVNDLLKKLEN